MLTRIYRYLLVMLTFVVGLAPASLSALAPPREGRFPPGFLAAESGSGETFRGDPGWVRKLSVRRETRLWAKRGKSEKDAQTRDTLRIPILLGEFSNVAWVHQPDEIRNLLFGDNPTGSLADYFTEVSYNQFHLTGDVHGWFTSDHTQKFYAGENYGRGEAPKNRAGFAAELIRLADPSVDFGMYDNDGPDGIPNSGDDDGIVDAVICVCSGNDPSGNDAVQNIWPGAGYLNEVVFTNDHSANGGRIAAIHYITCVECTGSGSGLAGIGVYAHELGHILGLPDLYDRTDETMDPDRNKSEGIGRWCLMAGGSWGGDGMHQEAPSHLSAWCKVQLGWVTPVLISEQIHGLPVPAVETSPVVFKLWEDGYAESRYFLLENRRRTGFDRYLHGEGLLIYHVDEYRSCGKLAWMWGACNDDETHKLVDVEEADGRNDLDGPDKNRGDDGDPFPGSTLNRAFADYTIPSSRDYAGSRTGVAVTGISDPGEVMTIDVHPRKLIGHLLMYDKNGMSGWGWGMSEPADFWGGVLFTPTESGRLTGIDVGINTPDTRFELTVFGSFANHSPDAQLATLHGATVTAGWYTIPLPDSGIAVEKGQDFFIRLKVEEKNYSISYDRTASRSGRSYVSGNGVIFSDAISTSSAGGNINIRARIKTGHEETLILVEESPSEFRIHPPYPNPFNPLVTISFDLPAPARVHISIHDILGQTIRVLVDDVLPSGRNAAVWNGLNHDGRPAGSGVYLYRLTAGRHHGQGKLLLMK